MWTSFIGFMACGKTSLTACLRESTSRPTVSTDQLVVQQTGMSIDEIFTQRGEEAFRDLEMGVLKELDGSRNLVIDTGGGILEKEGTGAILRQRGVVIWLDVPWEDIRARLGAPGAGDRPLVHKLGWAGLEKLYRRRRRLYASIADFRLVNKTDSIEELARQAMLRSLLLQRRREGGRP